MIGFDYILLVGSGLILLSIAIAKASDNLGVPTLLLFLGLGMLAGSEGPGGIDFDDPFLAQSIGVIALIFILFSGGLDTEWSSVRPAFSRALSLSTLGVFLTALLVGVFSAHVFEMSLLEGLLLGSVMSSTDAAAVFSVLRARNVSLKPHIRSLLELESGSNDPMAIFLTIGLIQLILNPEASFGDTVVLFVFQMGLGGVIGIAAGKGMVLILNKLKFSYEGLYPVSVLASACMVYAIASVVGGSGFLAVYIAGVVAGNAEFVHKKTLLRFFDGLAWLSQIGMFLTLGLFVFPSQLTYVIGAGLLVSFFLMFVARPVSVFVALALAKMEWREKTLVSWVGLRGAVPITLATFPMMAGVPNAQLMFNIVFFTVLTSALLQGWSIPQVARLLKVDAPLERRRKYPIEFSPTPNLDTELVDLIVPFNSTAIGKSLVELGLPDDSLVILISRNDEFLVPSGGTVLEEGDTLLVLVNKHNLPVIRGLLSEQRERTGGGEE